jgi:hypothetical protein
MRKQFILSVFIVSLIGATAIQAQEPRDFSLLPTKSVLLTGTNYSIVFNSPELQVGEPRDTEKLAAVISSWLSAYFGLPTMHRPPRFLYSETDKLPSYNSRSQTIYLPVGWNGGSPAQMSVFVREMARHLQIEAGSTYRCTPESFAEAVQYRWNEMFDGGRHLPIATSAISAGINPRCISQQSLVRR